MVRIGNSFDVQASQLGSASPSDNNNNSIWNSKKEQAPSINPQKEAQRLQNAIKKNNFQVFKQLILSASPNELTDIMFEYRNLTQLSLMDAVKTQFKDSPGVEEVEKALRNFNKGTYAHTEVLAYDLMQALNGEDTAKIEELMEDVKNMPPKRVKDLYTIYQHRSITLNKTAKTIYDKEIAATKEEKTMLGGRGDSWYGQLLDFLTFNHRKVKRNANRPETLLQGVLNNPALSLEKQEEYLRLISDKHIEVAKSKQIPQSKIDQYVHRANIHIPDAVANESSVVNNAYDLEESLAELFGYKGN